jgi:polyisoprenoid-binding protein YceI
MRHATRAHIGLSTLAIALAGAFSVRAANPRTFTVDATRSRSLIEVGKSGAFSFVAGHAHEVEAPIASGVVHLDPADPSSADVHLEFDAAAMRVSAKDEPPGDVPKVQEAMLGEQVLDVRRYPKITLQSTSVSTVPGKPDQTPNATMFDLTVAGNLTLRGVTKPFRAPVNVRLETDRGGRGDTLTATGKLSIKQTDYGIKPISVAGVVNVKDALNITFTIVARER